MRKNLGTKNGELSDIFRNDALGYWKVTVERPLRIKGTDPRRSSTNPTPACAGLRTHTMSECVDT